MINVLANNENVNTISTFVSKRSTFIATHCIVIVVHISSTLDQSLNNSDIFHFYCL